MSSKTISARTYWVVWGVLMILLVLTWGMSELDLHVFNTVVALVIAFIKMILVILFFMHVRYNSRITWIFAGAGFIWLMIMINFTMTDYLTRGRVRPPNRIISYWEYGPPQAPPGGYPGGVDPSGLQQPPAGQKSGAGN